MAGLTLQELYALNSMLCSDQCQTLEQVSQAFNRAFLQPAAKYGQQCSSGDRLRLGLAIASLLGHADLLPEAAHRIVAVYLLCVELNPVERPLSAGIHSARAELAAYFESNPFVALALDLLDSPEAVGGGGPPAGGEQAQAQAVAHSPGGAGAQQLFGKSGHSQSPCLPAAAEVTPIEREFLVHLLAAGSGALLAGKTPSQLAQFEIPPVNEAQHKQVALLRRAVAARLGDARPPVGSIPGVAAGCTNVRSALPALINVPQTSALSDPQYTEQKATLNTAEALLVCRAAGSSSSSSSAGGGDTAAALALAADTSAFRPKCIVPPPPIAPVGVDELVWLDWDGDDFDSFKPIFYVPDEQEMAESLKQGGGGAGATMQPEAVMRRALSTQLQLAESNFLIERLRAPDGLALLHSVDMSPDKLSALVEDNPMVAVEVLLRLLPSPHVTAYFAALINMELSVHGMEVVNRLCSQVDIPEEFLHVYVTQCIQACESMRQQPFTQNRLVRMVCVFLSSLIRNRLIRVRDLHVELQAFCIGFNSVKEAAALYQTIQMMNQEERANE